jgi:hypothetical protein
MPVTNGFVPCRHLFVMLAVTLGLGCGEAPSGTAQQVPPNSRDLGARPANLPGVAPAPEGQLILHRHNGDEVYRLKSAVMHAFSTKEGVTLCFEARADRKGAQRGADTAEFPRDPKAEVEIDLSELKIAQLVGRTFSLPGTKNDDEDSATSLFYYYDHQPLRANQIAVVSRKGDHFRVRWTAVTPDVSDGSKPQTVVEIEGDFLFQDIGKWSDGDRGSAER